ncbi:hypothetical protein KIN20_022643 [Parelaphostrongylus tenuis]|uniref:Uncharacterized protein n=1 Tax=Parelaphostrongylus tenuis TaxID=148309 RepID=A0AAD5MUG0_PARTN|nr:hypothetical protein KIN20_022643 [Parelaphostrongylus tenuis]
MKTELFLVISLTFLYAERRDDTDDMEKFEEWRCREQPTKCHPLDKQPSIDQKTLLSSDPKEGQKEPSLASKPDEHTMVTKLTVVDLLIISLCIFRLILRPSIADHIRSTTLHLTMVPAIPATAMATVPLTHTMEATVDITEDLVTMVVTVAACSASVEEDSLASPHQSGDLELVVDLELE